MNFKIQMNEDDQTIASLLFEGCSMGIETLYKYLHQYENASSKIKEVTEKLIEIEKRTIAKYTKLFINNYETNSFRNFFLNKPFDTSF